ncbi:MAG: SWIM zinc finger family protein [Pirellulales bacterium]
MMSQPISREDVLRLAPDASSAKSGQELGQDRKWMSRGGDSQGLWGECQGSGKLPYQVRVDLSDLATKCSCPSRKFPCKHALGLLLLHVEKPVASTAPPAWVVEWRASREARAAQVAEKPKRATAASDPAASAKRRGERWDRVKSGLADLKTWAEDLVRVGIASAPGKGFEFFDHQARRLVDAQAPGAARWVRELGSCAAAGEGWQGPFLERLSLLHLMTVAAERADSLPSTVRADLEATLGLTVAAAELDQLPALRDDWQVVSHEVELDDRLRVQRHWLFGRKHRRTALHLSFAHGNAPLDGRLRLGESYDAELVFYPGSGMRAALRGDFAPAAEAPWNGCDSLAELLDRYAHGLADCPWLESLGLPLVAVAPQRGSSGWLLCDRAGEGLPLRAAEPSIMALLAVSGGNPVDIAVEFDGRSLRPMCLATSREFINLRLYSGEGVGL